jgi:hypothetical protein
MKSGDIVVGGGEAWQITGVDDATKQVKFVKIAGPDLGVIPSEVPLSFLNGKTVYRAVSELADVDAKLAGDEVARYVNTGAMGWNPRLWVEAFAHRYKGHKVPDNTVLLGWFSRLIDAGYDKHKASAAEKRAGRKAPRKQRTKKAPISRKKKNGASR